MTEAEAIESLVALSTISTPATPTRQTTTATAKVKPVASCTPKKTFKAAGYKRVRDGLVHVLFQTDG